MGLQRFLIAEHTDMADTGGGHHAQHAVHQAEACTEDRDNGELLAGQCGHFRLAQGRFDFLGRQGQVTGRLVGDQHTDLRNQFPESLDAGVLVTHDGQLVCHQRVIHNVYFFTEHCIFLRQIYIYKFTCFPDDQW